MNIKKRELLEAIETIKDFGGDNNTILYYLLPELGFDENKELSTIMDLTKEEQNKLEEIEIKANLLIPDYELDELPFLDYGVVNMETDYEDTTLTEIEELRMVLKLAEEVERKFNIYDKLNNKENKTKEEEEKLARLHKTLTYYCSPIEINNKTLPSLLHKGLMTNKLYFIKPIVERLVSRIVAKEEIIKDSIKGIDVFEKEIENFKKVELLYNEYKYKPIVERLVSRIVAKEEIIKDSIKGIDVFEKEIENFKKVELLYNEYKYLKDNVNFSAFGTEAERKEVDRLFELEEELKKWTEEHQNDRFYIDSFVGYNELDEFVLLPYRLKQLQNILNSCKKVLEIA